MKRLDVDMFRPRSHRHICGHHCFCHLGHFAATTDCRKCRNERFREQARKDVETMA